MSGGRLAVREGFEPSLGFHLNTLSKRARSTTPPPHRSSSRARKPRSEEGDRLPEALGQGLRGKLLKSIGGDPAMGRRRERQMRPSRTRMMMITSTRPRPPLGK